MPFSRKRNARVHFAATVASKAKFTRFKYGGLQRVEYTAKEVSGHLIAGELIAGQLNADT